MPAFSVTAVKSLLLGALPLAVTAETITSFTWTRCTNVERCENVEAPGSPTGQSLAQLGPYVIYPGAYNFPYSKDAGWVYDGSNGYWYSADVDGEYVSPEGYLNFAKDFNRVGIVSKNGDVGATYWRHRGEPCCLPDEVGTLIYDITSYKMDIS
ncbi:hypothetical protein Cob_v001248 [Colletotrichum orbiculare MAFF 240422]|uniref:Uncharacterized protein n=1 Tax=Colletotrichum orbiculare (strain 104-T / ATCC 96160 / CBS 514.97 / LARS 414 / MAFF 240422) TaxID=1213857 RepID=N4W1X9_COLOR|nr:hypothetical protein Cob_v001248 [Colletotrichum orbiculare MAFF 240422]